METIKEILLRNGFSFKKQFGQNFITDTNLLKSIVALADVGSDTTVLEIGCGAGTLTRALAKQAKRVVAYEIDAKLQPVLAETLAGAENAEVVFRDFLKADLPSLEKELGKYTVVANLPYYITSPLTMKFIEESEKAIQLRREKLAGLKAYDNQRYYLEEEINNYCDLILILSLSLAETERGIRFFLKNSIEIRKEIILYRALEIARWVGTDAQWLDIYRYGVSKKIKPREELVERYRKLMEKA